MIFKQTAKSVRFLFFESSLRKTEKIDDGERAKRREVSGRFAEKNNYGVFLETYVERRKTFRRVDLSSFFGENV